MRRFGPAVRRAALLVALSACVDGPGGPSRFGEVRVEPAYRAGFEPGAIGVALDSASVVAVSATGERLLDHKVPYTGGPLAWVVDLEADEESVSVTVGLWSGGALRYSGDTAVVVESGAIASGQTHTLSVAYVGPPIVSTVTVLPATDTLRARGAARQFTAEARDPGGDVVVGATFAWASSDGAVATIDAATGLATAVGHGSTAITATASGVSASATLAVRLPPVVVSVVVMPATATLSALDATQQFTAEARDASGAVVPGVALAWASTSGAVATIDAATGLATAAGHGSTTITATTGGVSGSATLSVDLAATVTSVVVTPANATLTVLGATQQFTAEARDASGAVVAGVTFTWTSSAAAVATVDAATGLASATGHGSTTITATAGSVSGSATLDVNLAATVATVVVSPAGATLTALGATQQFTAEARDAGGAVVPGVVFTWASSAGAVATIETTTGIATAAGHGSTTITATAGGVSGSATLEVNLAATVATVVVSPAGATLTALGATQQFTAEARDAGGAVVPGVVFTWASSAGAVATIETTTGIATAAGHGSTTITATAGGVSGSATLEVNLAATVTTVVVTPGSATLTALGATQQFVAEARDAGGAVVPGVVFTWTSSALTVATVDVATGLATAAGHGSTTITATAGSASGSATFDVNLAATVATVVVTPANATLTALGATQQFTAEARDAGGAVVPGVTFTWTSSAAAVATVDAATGLASATGHGSTTITATAGSVSGSATLDVNLAATVATVVVSPAGATLTALGATQQFAAEARDTGGAVVPGVVFTWASSAGAVATIETTTGIATAAGHGSTTITATAGGVSGSATLDVNLAATVATVVVSPANATLNALGATQQFTAQARDAGGAVVPGVVFTWTSSAGAVATIDAATGLATAVGHGSTTIRATTGGLSGSATLDANLAATVATVVVSPANATLNALGATQQFTAQARDAGGAVVPGVVFTWTSSATAVATIDAATGLATAVGHGSTTITATAGSVSGSATLDVNLAATVTTVVVTPAGATLTALGATQQFTAEARDAVGAVLPGVLFTWTSSATAVATIDAATGLATAAGHGSTTITATTGSVSGSATLDVSLVATVTSVVVTPANATVTALGATQQFTAEARDASNNVVPGVSFTWMSTGDSAATIDVATGLATAVGNGSATISATVGGVQGSAELTVSQVIATIIVSPDSATIGGLNQEPRQQFTAEARDANGFVIAGVAFVWASIDPTIATVDATGLATAVQSGTTTITASAGGVTGVARLLVP